MTDGPGVEIEVNERTRAVIGLSRPPSPRGGVSWFDPVVEHLPLQ